MEKDFDGWNKEKKRVNGKEISFNFFFHPREVWWCAIGINVGIETDGKNDNYERPVLIIKKFNGDQFWGVPLTTNKKEGKFYQKIKHDDGVSWANLSQLRIFSSKRLIRQIGKIISEEEFKKICIDLKNFI